MASEDLQTIVDHVVNSNYAFLNSLDVSNNRIQGVEGGKAIANLISRQPIADGLDFEILNVSLNKLGNGGASLILNAAANENCRLLTLKMQ